MLFLADKLAALEVVKDRLDAAGLGDFCLELHSDKAHPKPIIESLKQRYDLAQYAGDEPNWREELQRLRSARGRVRDYLSALHGRDHHEVHTPFDLMWATIAARRELAKEFDAVRRLNLEGIFSKGWHEIEREKDALKLYARVVEDYRGRHGPFANAVWSKAGFAELSDDDPDIVADNIRDAYESGKVLSELLAATSSTIELDLPRSPKTIKAWADFIFCLPAIEEDYLLPKLGTLSLLDIEAAAKLATERMELVARPMAQLPSDKFEAVGQLAGQLEHTEFMDISPAAIVVRTNHMLAWEQSLIEGLKVFSQLIVAFRPSSAPSIATARDMASIVRFANTIPPGLDSYLWFDRFEFKAVLEDGATRLLNLSDRDGALRAQLHLAAETQWPPLDDLRIVAEVSAARGLHRIGATLSGKRRRAKRVVEKMGGGAKLTANDINEAISFVEDRNAFLAHSSLSAAADSAWSGLTTPLEEMVAVLQFRSRFDKENDRSSGFVEKVYQALFSSNRKVVDALRKYDPWSGSILSALKEWPDSLESVPLSEAAERVSARVEKFTGITARIQELKLAVLLTSFAEIKREVDRQKKIAALESKITAHQVFAMIGEQVWLSPNGCRSLQLSAQIARAIATASPNAGIRARLFSKGAASFRRSLDFAASAINRALENYRTAFDRLSQTGMLPGTGGDDDVRSIVERLSPLMRELASLREWLEVARRRSLLRSNGTDGLVNAFEDAGLSPDRLPETFGALAFHYYAARVRHSRPVLRNMKSLDLENERSRFVTADNALKKRQREAVRLRLLKTTIPVGSGAGAKRDWTDLQCLRNEFTKQARHLPIRRLLSRSGRATQAMKPCFMMSPLSLAKFLPSRIMNFDLLVIDEASQMKPEDSAWRFAESEKGRSCWRSEPVTSIGFFLASDASRRGGRRERGRSR